MLIEDKNSRCSVSVIILFPGWEEVYFGIGREDNHPT